MDNAVRRGSLAVLLTIVAACSPAAPVTGSPSSRIFVADPALSQSVAPSTLASQFVLYDDGRFVLKLAPQNPGHQGRYAQANGTVTFEWEATSQAGPWGATGTLRGDTLSVHYNMVMQLTDFEDAVYVRAQ